MKILIYSINAFKMNLYLLSLQFHACSKNKSKNIYKIKKLGPMAPAWDLELCSAHAQARRNFLGAMGLHRPHLFIDCFLKQKYIKQILNRIKNMKNYLCNFL